MARQTQIPFTISTEIDERVHLGFDGYIGQDDAVHAIKRMLRLALASTPPAMTEAVLLTGPSSAGKTEMAERVGRVMALPFTKYTGEALRNLNQVAAAMERAASSNNLSHPLGVVSFTRVEDRGGMPAYSVPPMIFCIDEAHLMKPATQQAFLTAFAASDRTMVIERAGVETVFDVSRVGFILCTTHPASLVRTLRNRCNEIALRAYRQDEVEQIVRQQYDLPADVVARIVKCAKLLPRKALKLADLTLKESASSRNPDLLKCLGIVVRGAGIVSYDGLTRNDVLYLRILARLNGRGKPRPAGLSKIMANLGEVEREEILREVEPFLLSRRNIEMHERGRIITYGGQLVLDEHREEFES